MPLAAQNWDMPARARAAQGGEGRGAEARAHECVQAVLQSRAGGKEVQVSI